jgi:DNA recombination protein RmuC
MNTALIILICINSIAVLLLLVFLLRRQDDSLARGIREELAQNRQELSRTIKLFEDSLRETVERRLQALQDDNGKKLEQMRQTVDEKLNATLEKRLTESFRLVSERLEAVHKGLGEMQALASGVGDLKRVLTNVKTRGTMGEVVLGGLLEQMLSPEQYEKNVATRKGSLDRVEYAIKLPGHDDGHVWLPLDAKFPQEDYQRLLDARDAADAAGAEAALRQLIARIKLEAKTIRDKYIDPPNTVDFAIMFVPVEGLYAEILQTPGLHESLQREYRVSVTGPTTLCAYLNSLQLGFRTLAIQKRSSEVWELLGVVKTHFGKFGDLLEKTRKKLTEAGNSIEDASRKSRYIEKRLSRVQELPVDRSADVLLDEDPV